MESTAQSRISSSRHPSFRRRGGKIFTALLFATLAPAPGCVERLIQIRSDPSGAEVYVNGAPVVVKRDGKVHRAVTPVDVPFDFPGTYEITLRRAGYDSARQLVPVLAPYYSYPPLDFIVEHFVPWTIRNHHEVTFTLQSRLPLDDQAKTEIIERATKLEKEVENRDEEMGDPKRKETPE